MLPKFFSSNGKYVLCFIFIVGIAFRTLGTTSYSDEFYVMDGIGHMLEYDTWEPDRYNHPNHIELYANRIVFSAISRVRFGESLRSTYQDNLGFYMAIARKLHQIAGCIELLLVFLIGRFFAYPVALMATGLYAVYPDAIFYSQVIRPDTTLNVAMLATVWLSMWHIRTRRMIFAFWASVTAALSVAVKYPGLINMITVVLTVSVVNFRDKNLCFHRVLTAITTFLISLFLFAPFLFLRPLEVVDSLRYESRESHFDMKILGPWGNMGYYLEHFIQKSHLIILLFAVFGAAVCVRFYVKKCAPIFTGFAYWVLLSMLSLHWDRWGMPLYVTLILLASVGIHHAFLFVQQAEAYKKYAGFTCMVSALAIAVFHMWNETIGLVLWLFSGGELQ